MATKAEIHAELETLKAEHEALKDKHEKFEARIIEVAGQAAVDHGLCHVLEETLEAIGISIPTVTVTLRREATIEVGKVEYLRYAPACKAGDTLSPYIADDLLGLATACVESEWTLVGVVDE